MRGTLAVFHFSWISILVNGTLFRPMKNPLFLVDLVMDLEGVHYSTALPQYETVLVNLFDKAISSTHTVPQLEKVSNL